MGARGLRDPEGPVRALQSPLRECLLSLAVFEKVGLCYVNIVSKVFEDAFYNGVTLSIQELHEDEWYVYNYQLRNVDNGCMSCLLKQISSNPFWVYLTFDIFLVEIVHKDSPLGHARCCPICKQYMD